ncbi:TPA: phage tail protein [Streptococcus suis]
MAETKFVSAGKPKAGGAIATAAVGTTLPTDATTEINKAFVNLGYISEDGLTNENTREAENIKAWGGDVVASLQSEKEDKFSYTLIEIANVDVLKEVFGQDNVAGDLESGIAVQVNAKELEERSIVVDMILNGGILKRIVIPNGKIVEMGEIVYKDDEVAGYEVTIQALPDSTGNTHYEYLIKPGSTKSNSRTSITTTTSATGGA